MSDTVTIRQTFPSVLVAALAAIFAFPIWSFFDYLWNREHYRFFPFVLAVIIYVFWSSRPLRLMPARGWRKFVRTATTAVAALAILLTPFVASAWLAGITILLGLTASSLWLRGNNRFNLSAAAALFLLIIPPPLNYDVLLIQRLQGFASHASSELLDFIGISHLMRGNLTVLPDRTFFVEEACAGVHSLFSLAAATGILCVLTRRSLLVSAGLLLISVFWALITNIVRITTVVVAWDIWQVDLVGGWKHELLGILVFALAMGLCWSTAVFLSFLTGPVSTAFKERDSETIFHANWNRFADPARRLRNQKRKVKSGALVPSATFSKFSLIALSSAAVIVVGVNLMRSPWRHRFANSAVVARLNAVLDKDLWSQTAGPGLSGLQVVRFEATDRDFMSSWGQHSRAWDLQTALWQGRLSVDYLWQHQHDLSKCYGGIGWTVRSELRRPGLDDPDWPIIVLELDRPGGAKAIVLFSMFDSDGGTFFNPSAKDFAGVVGTRIKQEMNRLVQFKEGVVQVQLLVPQVSLTDEAVVAGIIEDFSTFRSLLRNRVQTG